MPSCSCTDVGQVRKGEAGVAMSAKDAWKKGWRKRRTFRKGGRKRKRRKDTKRGGENKVEKKKTKEGDRCKKEKK